MSKIKSTRASKLISYGALSQEYARTKCGYALVTTTTAKEAIIIAETELTEHYEQHLQELRDRAMEAHRAICINTKCQSNTAYDKGFGNNQCFGNCAYVKQFAQKLTEKQ